MRRASLLVMIVAALAGCGADEPAPVDFGAGGAPAASPAPAVTPGEPTGLRAREHVPIGDGGAIEASIAASDDGRTLLACSHGKFAGPSPAWLSIDGGATWDTVVPAFPIRAGDCDVAVLPTGALAIVYATEYSGCLVVHSEDRSSWQLAALGGVPLYPGPCDRPWFALDGSDLLLTHKSINNIPLVVAFQRSTDGGATWTTAVVAARGEEGPRLAGAVGPMVVRDGRILLPLHRFDGGTPTALGTPEDHVLEIVSSNDGGETWSSQRVAGPFRAPIFMPILVALPNGELILSYKLSGKGHFISQVDLSSDGSAWRSARTEPYAYDEQRTVVWPGVREDGEPYLVWQEWREDAGWALRGSLLAGDTIDLSPTSGEENVKLEFAMARGDLIAFAAPGKDCSGLCVGLTRAPSG